jgi:hypothetical protein
MRYRIEKATVAQKRDYAERKINGAINPLHGFVWVGNRRLYVEGLQEGRDDPKYEVMAPAGMRFMPDGVTTLLCFSLHDLDNRLQSNELERNPEPKPF